MGCLQIPGTGLMWATRFVLSGLKNNLLLPFYFPSNLFGCKLVFDVLIEKGTGRTFALYIQLEDLPHSWRYIVIPIDITSSKFNLHHFIFFIIINPVNGGGFRCEYRLCHSK